MNIRTFYTMFSVLIFLTFLSTVNTDILVYLLGKQGKAISYNGNTLNFSNQTFGNKTQLWKFTTDGDLIECNTDMYLGFSHTTLSVEMKRTSDISWYWEGDRLKAEDQSPSRIVCITDSLLKVSVSCGQEGADISIQLHDQHTEDIVREISSLVEVSTKEIASNITGLEKTSTAVDSHVTAVEADIVQWNSSVVEYVSSFTEQSNTVSDNITITRGHVEDEMGSLKGGIANLQEAITNITSHLNTTHVDLSELWAALELYRNNTESTVKGKLAAIQVLLDKKSTNGHVIPENIYDFVVLILVALGLVNMVDITRRLVRYAIGQKRPVKYGTE